MHLAVPHTTPDGQRVLVDQDVLDIDRRLKHGDPTLGWAGDPGLWLEFDPRAEVFVVCWRNPRNGEEMVVTRYAPPLDSGLIRKLVEADTQRRGGNDPVAKMLAADDKHERDRAAALEDFIDNDAAPRMVHAMRKDGVPDVPPAPVYFPDNPLARKPGDD